jgi:hypothetical protein
LDRGLTKLTLLLISGYNGAFDNYEAVLDARNEFYGPRPDGEPWAWTKDIVPARIWIGRKGLMEDGEYSM